jgi:hypothetical protein
MLSCWHCLFVGETAMIVVPGPGSLVIASVAPICSARSFMTILAVLGFVVGVVAGSILEIHFGLWSLTFPSLFLPYWQFPLANRGLHPGKVGLFHETSGRSPGKPRTGCAQGRSSVAEFATVRATTQRRAPAWSALFRVSTAEAGEPQRVKQRTKSRYNSKSPTPNR